jgi:surfeit locus 1 family protein
VSARVVGATLLAAVLVGLAGLLGWWQLESWQTQREQEARDLTGLAPVPLAEALGPDQPFPTDQVGRPVTVEGTWLPDGSVHVSGRERDGREGYWAVTPLAVGGPDQPAVLVVRGWTPDPDSEPPSGPGTIVGWLQPPEGSGAAFDEDPRDDVLPELRIADAVQRVDQDLYGAFVVLDTDRTAEGATGDVAPATLEQLPEVGATTGLRNLLYAVEWWFFGAFAAFIWWRWVRDETGVTRAEGEAAAEPEPVETDG